MRKSKLNRRTFVAALAATYLISLALAPAFQPIHHTALAQEPQYREHWVGTWSAAASPGDLGLFGTSRFANTGFDNQTVRMIVRASIGGPRVRVKLSNEYGNEPLVIGAAHIAICKGGAAIVPGTDRVLTFGARPSVAIPAGAVFLSDPVKLDVPRLAELTVSVFVPGNTGPTTWHPWGHHQSYISGPGDLTAASDMPTAATKLSWYWLSAVDVIASVETGAIVVVGDSISEGDEGDRVKPEPYSGWPDVLTRRLLNEPGHHPPMAVLNEGIAGNRLLHDFIGTNALARLERDGLGLEGTKSIIIQEGMNDIGVPTVPMLSAHAQEIVTSDEIIGGLRQIAERAQAGGIKVFACTLIPMGGSAYDSPENEAKREAVNQWIRASGVFDGVFDFDAIIRDPSNLERILPEYDPNDHMHPNGSGYEAMGNAIDLRLFRTSPQKN